MILCSLIEALLCPLTLPSGLKLGTHEAWVAVTRAWSKLYASHDVWLALPISNKLNDTLKLQPEELRIFNSEEFSSLVGYFLFFIFLRH